jgi:hypothetical protein
MYAQKGRNIVFYLHVIVYFYIFLRTLFFMDIYTFIHTDMCTLYCADFYTHHSMPVLFSCLFYKQCELFVDDKYKQSELSNPNYHTILLER